MKPNLLPILLAGSAFVVASCLSSHYEAIDEKTPGATFQKGVPGATVVETQELTATVTDLDVPNRKVTLTDSDGKKTPVKCGPEVINFDQIKVGDRVRATVTAELTVGMANAADASSEGSAAVVALAPRGAKPGLVMAETQRYNATITAIDYKKRRASLLFPDGTTRTFAVRKDVDLSQRKVGEEVAFRVTVATAISIRKP